MPPTYIFSVPSTYTSNELMYFLLQAFNFQRYCSIFYNFKNLITKEESFRIRKDPHIGHGNMNFLRIVLSSFWSVYNINSHFPKVHCSLVHFHQEKK